MRHIDHAVLAVRELDRAADLYRKLGFLVGARNRHPWGTENRLVQFNSSFLELITIGEDARFIPPHREHRFSFGAFVRDYLEKREGVAMLVLSSTDATSDATLFSEQEIGKFEPFFFERKGTKADGMETDVAFTLAFARDTAAPDIGFFVCQQHRPENFWIKSFQEHVNSALDISAVTLASPHVDQHAEFLTRFSGSERQLLASDGLRFPLEGGRIDVIPSAESQPQLTSLSIRVRNIDPLRCLLSEQGTPFSISAEGVIVIPPVHCGFELRFESNVATR